MAGRPSTACHTLTGRGSKGTPSTPGRGQTLCCLQQQRRCTSSFQQLLMTSVQAQVVSDCSQSTCRYPREHDTSDRNRGGSFRDDNRGSFNSRGSFSDRDQDRGDRRGFGSNFDQEERRGSFRDRGRSDYGQLQAACAYQVCHVHVHAKAC